MKCKHCGEDVVYYDHINYTHWHGVDRCFATTTVELAEPTIKESKTVERDLSKCPGCGGPADNGHDRCVPPNPYYCTKCDPNPKQEPQGVEWLEPAVGANSHNASCVRQLQQHSDEQDNAVNALASMMDMLLARIEEETEQTGMIINRIAELERGQK